MKAVFSFIVASFIVTASGMSFALAHGEDKEGPNGGFIMMPGPFHTEVVQAGKNKLKVYLLDMEYKNPTLQNSKVEAQFGKDKWISCAAQKEPFFLCVFAKNADLSKKGEVKIKAQRESQAGNEAVYELPLKVKEQSHH